MSLHLSTSQQAKSGCNLSAWAGESCWCYHRPDALLKTVETIAVHACDGMAMLLYYVTVDRKTEEGIFFSI